MPASMVVQLVKVGRVSLMVMVKRELVFYGNKWHLWRGTIIHMYCIIRVLLAFAPASRPWFLVLICPVSETTEVWFHRMQSCARIPDSANSGQNKLMGHSLPDMHTGHSGTQPRTSCCNAYHCGMKHELLCTATQHPRGGKVQLPDACTSASALSASTGIADLASKRVQCKVTSRVITA